MAITFVASTIAASATGTIPSGGQDGDFMVAFASRDASATAPTNATGWDDRGAGGAGTTSMRTATRPWSAGMSNPVFTNATSVWIGLYRGVDIFNLPTGEYRNNTGTSTSITWPAITPLDNTSGSSWMVLGAVGARPDVTIPTPTGTTVRGVSGTRPGFWYGDTNGGVSTWAAHSSTVSRSDSWTTCEIELIAKTTTTVGASRRMPYSMIGAVGASKRLPYNVRAFVGSSRRMPYTLTLEVGASLIQPYEILGDALLVGASLAMPYSLSEEVGASLIMPWIDKAVAGKSLALPWVDKAIASTARAMPWTDRANVGASRRLPYGTRQIVGSSRRLPYMLRVFVAQSLRMLYDIDALAVKPHITYPTDVALSQHTAQAALRTHANAAELVK